jgi:putative ABC transport system permease protein
MLALLIDLRIAVLNLIEHRRRSLFLGSAIATVTVLCVLLQGLASGLRNTMIDMATTLTTGHLNVGGFFKPTTGQAAPMITNYEPVLAAVKRAMPELESVVMRGRGWGKLVGNAGSLQVGIAGVDIASEPALRQRLAIEAGSIDELAQPNTILIFHDQAKKLDLKVGDTLTISSQTTWGVANTMDCRVIAIARDVGLLSQYSAFVSNESLRTLFQLRPDVAGALQIYVKPEDVRQLDRLAGRLRRSLEDAGYRVLEPDARPYWMKFENVAAEDWTDQKLDVTTWEDELSFMMWTVDVLQGLSGVLMLILFIIVVTGIMNTLWIAIRERTREIGTLRAIGMQRRNVVRMFLLESTLLGLVSAVIGVGLGLALTLSLNAAAIHVPLAVQVLLMTDRLTLAVDAASLLTVVALMTVVTGGAAFYPSLRIGRLRPVDAMSHFG